MKHVQKTKHTFSVPLWSSQAIKIILKYFIDRLLPFISIDCKNRQQHISTEYESNQIEDKNEFINEIER